MARPNLPGEHGDWQVVHARVRRDLIRRLDHLAIDLTGPGQRPDRAVATMTPTTPPETCPRCPRRLFADRR